MTGDRFIDICEKSFSANDKKPQLGQHQREIYLEKLRRFKPEELDAIFDKVLEITRQFPKIKDIYDAAQDCGFLQTPMQVFTIHKWDETECALCRGEGRLLVIWELSITEHHKEQHILRAIQPYSARESKLDDNCFRSIFRCCCLAAEKDSIPKSWPRWSRDIQPVRTI